LSSPLASYPFLIAFSLRPLPPPISPLFPYTTLFRSLVETDLPEVAYRLEHPQVLALTLPPVPVDARHRIVIARDHDSVSSIHRKDRKSTRLNSSHVKISYAVFCLKKKKKKNKVYEQL